MAKNYAPKEELRKLLLTARETGDFSARLIEIVYTMAVGLFARHKFKECVITMDDYKSECSLQLFLVINKINLDENPFSYLTTVFFNIYRARYRQHLNSAAFHDKLIQREIDSCEVKGRRVNRMKKNNY